MGYFKRCILGWCLGGCEGGNLACFSAAMAPVLDAQRYEKITNKSHAENFFNVLQLLLFLLQKKPLIFVFAKLTSSISQGECS